MKHHYIPQFYLEPWINRETDDKLTEYRRLKFDHEQQHRLEIKRRGKMETGWENNLYIIPGATKETKQNVERIFMGAVDGKAALARDMMLGGKVPMEPELRQGRRSVYAFDEQSTADVKRRMSRRPYMAPMAWDVLKS